MKSSLLSRSALSLYYIDWYFFVWLVQLDVCFILPLISNLVLTIESNNLDKSSVSLMKISTSYLIIILTLFSFLFRGLLYTW